MSHSARILRRLQGGQHRGDRCCVTGPELELNGGLVDQHAEPADRPGSRLFGRNQQRGAQRLVDDVGHDLVRTEQ